MATDWQIGDLIKDRYEIHKILKGGMGVVYVVYDHTYHEAFAAKTFQDEVFGEDPTTADRFRQEALAWINLDAHENIARGSLVETVEGKPFLFLEYVDGGDLGNWIGTPRLVEDLPQVLRFAIQFCDGMTHALAHGIKAHRDVKPANCLITRDIKLKVTDFGIASVSESDSAESRRNRDLAQTGVGAGTPPYMAPEQFDDFKRVDVRADIYSFGIMLFEMAAGRRPFAGRSWEEFQYLHKQQAPPLLSSGSAVLNAVVHGCLAKDRDRRFAEFRVVRQRLDDVYERLTGERAPQPATAADLSVREWVNKGYSLGGLRREDDAIACYDRALEINPEYAVAWFNKGASLGILGRPIEAIGCFDRAVEIDPRDAVAWSHKGIALRTLGRFEDSIACCDRALDIKPTYADAWCNRGASLGQLSRHNDALTCYDTALIFDKRHAVAWSCKANTLARLGRVEEALPCYDRALAIDPRDSTAWLNKSKVLYSLGQREQGLTCLDHALQTDPRCAEAWYNKGVHFGGQERRGDAISCYDRALEINPRYANAWCNKGVTLADLRRREEAIACFDRAIEADPRCIAAWCNKGKSLTVLGRRDDALACYDQALKIDPRYANAWYTKAAGLFDAGRFEDALACYDQALVITPCDANAWFGKAGALLILMRVAEAIACFEQAGRLGIPSATAHIEAVKKNFQHLL